MKSKIALLLAFCFINSFTPAQAACINAQKNEYVALNVSFLFQQEQLKNVLHSKYCYDFENFSKMNNIAPSIYFVRNINDLNVFIDTRIPIDTYKTGKYQLDPLSYFLLQLNTKISLTEKDKNDLFNLEKQYYPNISRNSLNIQPLNYDNYSKLLKSMAQEYSKSYHLPLNNQNNTPLSFAVVANEPQVLKLLLDTNANRKAALYRKNNQGISAFHLAFANKKPILGNKNSVTQLNDILLNNLENLKLNYLKVENVSFLEFVELFKEQNMDFYQKLHKKFTYTISPERLKNLQATKSNLQQRINFSNDIIAYELN